MTVATYAKVLGGLPKGLARRILPGLLTLLAMVIILVVCGIIQPRIWSQGGMTLIMSPIVALSIAAMSQMVLMSIGDIDLGIGFFVGMITTIVATFLRETPLIGVLALCGCVMAYALMGALVQLREVPSLIATLGASFIWLGVGLFVLPVPGGLAPDWLFTYALWRPPFAIPLPIITMVVATAFTWFIMQRTRLGVRFRMLGSNPVALQRSGASLLVTRMLAYSVVGLLGVLAGITLTAEIGGGDVNAVPGYTLTTIAAVILGGGMFTGGRGVSWGTLFGAITLGLMTVLFDPFALFFKPATGSARVHCDRCARWSSGGGEDREMKGLSNISFPPWTWSFLAAFVVLILTFVVSSGGNMQTLTLAFTIAPYLVLVGLGQMLVMSTGPGNIDVSVAKVFSLGGLLSIAVGDITGSWMLGMAAAMGAGLGLASISVMAILFVRIPPIVATLATSLITSAISLTLAKGFQGSADPALRGFLSWAPFGVPAFALLVIVFTILVSFLLKRTVWGTQTLALGQARRAAEYAGVNAAKTLAVVYLTCGVLAALAGALRAAFSAPNVELGNDYLLDSIAVVVIGGTLITGGRAVPWGVWGGALFFILLDGLLNLIGWSYAGQNVLKGVLVLAVLFMAGGAPILSRRKPTIDLSADVTSGNSTDKMPPPLT